MPSPQVTILTLNWNQPQHTLAFLHSYPSRLPCWFIGWPTASKLTLTPSKSSILRNNFPGKYKKMKKLVIISVYLLIAILARYPSTAASQSITYRTGFQLQNLSDTETAVITITYINPDGTTYTSIQDTIPANSAQTYFPLHNLPSNHQNETITADPSLGTNSLYFPFQVSANFDGAIIVTANQPLAGITNILGDGLDYGASYEGFNIGSETVNLPLIMKSGSGFHTKFSVQNTGSEPTNVTITYSDANCPETITTLQPGAAARIDQSTNACLSGGYVGAATLTADPNQSIVATVLEVGPDTLFAYNGFTTGSPNPAIPLISFNGSGFITGIQLQNTGTSPTDVTLNYNPIPGVGIACSETKTVNPGQSATFALYAFTFPNDPNPGTNDCSFGAMFVGSGLFTQTGNEPLVAISNQLNIAAGKGASFNGFNPTIATSTLVMPLLMDRNSGFWTGFNIQNVGQAPATITCTFTQTNGNNHTTATSPELQPGAAWNYLQINQLGENWIGSATCTGGVDSQILGIVNELQNNAPGDQFFAYTAFNK